MLFNLRVVLSVATALMFGVCGGARATTLAAANPHEMSLPEIAHHTMAIYFGEEKAPAGGLNEFAEKVVTKQHFLKSGGVFVTLYKNGKTRACWGSVLPQAKTIAKSTVYATMGALTKEYRYKPVSETEWKTLKTQVTVITGVEPIPSISFQNPLRDGLLVRSGGKAGVLLPGEASDAFYQLVQCKLKAGIKSGEPCQLYRLRTEIYE
jgi:AMMECR1 domain-containing protein